jgi:hypothetical protein
MDKKQALEIVSLIKEKKKEEYIQEVLIKIENYINKQEIFSYQDTMKFIEDQMSGIGGIYALVFLKNELKSEYEKSKKDFNKMSALIYLVKNSVYNDEWSGAGMYEAIEKIITSEVKFFNKNYLDSLLKEAAEF